MGRARRDQRDAKRKQRAKKRKKRTSSSANDATDEDIAIFHGAMPSRRSSEPTVEPEASVVVDEEEAIRQNQTEVDNDSTVDTKDSATLTSQSERIDKPNAAHSLSSTTKKPTDRIERLRLKKQQRKARQQEKRAIRRLASKKI